MTECAVDGLERFLVALNLMLNVVELGRLRGSAHRVGETLMLDMDQEFGEAPLDGFEMTKPAIGCIQFFDQCGDPVLQVVDCRVVSGRELELFQLVGEPMEHGVDVAGLLLVLLMS